MDTECPYLEWSRLFSDGGLGCEIAEVALVYREEGRLLFVETQFYFPRGAVAVFLYQNFGDTGAVGILGHLVFAVDEHDHVGVLFDRARIAEVGKARASAAGVHPAGEL